MGLIFIKAQDGQRRLNPLIILLVVIALIVAITVYFTSNTKPGLTTLTEDKDPLTQGPLPIQTEETLKTKQSEVDAETENAIQAQIEFEKEQNAGYLPESRIQEIREKHIRDYEEKSSTAFRTNQKERLALLKQRTPDSNAPASPDNPNAAKQQGYQTFAERMGQQANTTGGSRSFDLQEGTNNPNDPKNAKNKANNPNNANNANNANNINSSNSATNSSGASFATSKNSFQNMLPLGTYIPCILEGDVVTTDLSSHVWATVALDVTFRRQLQLPKGLVRARGSTATEPVQDLVDIRFDTLVFSDGTELPISGAAYSALDPRYPNRYKIRGIPGDLIKPPLYLKLQALLYGAAMGASEAYVENYTNENTQTESTYTTVPIVNPTTGNVTQQIQQTQKPPVNTNIGGTIGLSAAQSTLSELLAMAKEDLEKYRPYVMVEKGTPFYIQLDETIDISKRQINGVAIAAAEAEAKGKPIPKQNIYSRGDARSLYDPSGGVAGNPLGGSQQAIENQTGSYLERLQKISGMSSGTTTGTPSNALQPQKQNPNQNNQMLQELLQSLK